ncbi:MAG TPA: hypothetical protein VM427_09910 [Patescibacteria group bacterium]|nr:hypothetical protein [Patescibacteria group bacterium]
MTQSFGAEPPSLSPRGHRRRIAFYTPANLNVIDGSAIWVQSVCATLLVDGEVEVTLPMKVPERRDVVTSPLRGLGRVHLVPPPEGTHPTRGLTNDEVLDLLERLDHEQPFDVILLRSFELCLAAVDRPSLRSRIWSCYVLEPERNTANPDHLADLARIVAGSAFVVCQSEEMRALLESLVPTAFGRTILLPPAIPEAPEVARPDSTVIARRMLYAGKFHPFYPVGDMVRMLTALRVTMPDLEFHVAGDKIRRMPDDPTYAPTLERALSTTAGVVWHGGLSRQAVERLLAEGGVALSLWDYRYGSEINDLVISTKLLDYCSVGLPVILNRTVAQEAMLGPDYPLFVEEPADTVGLLRRVLADPWLYAAAGRWTLEATRRFTYPAVHARLRPYLLGQVGPSRPDPAQDDRPKLPGAAYNVGWIGQPTDHEGLRLAVALVDELVAADERFRLIVTWGWPASTGRPPAGSLAGPGEHTPASAVPVQAVEPLFGRDGGPPPDWVTIDGQVGLDRSSWLRKVRYLVAPGSAPDGLAAAAARSATILIRIAPDELSTTQGVVTGDLADVDPNPFPGADFGYLSGSPADLARRIVFANRVGRLCRSRG